MNLHASRPEIDALDGALRRAGTGEGVVATKVALAWHLRQRDSGRALALVQDVMPVVRGATPGDAIASCHARAALAAAEASALYGEVAEAERCLLDARAHLDAARDPQAEGDAWLVESLLARTCGQAERALAALRQASRSFARIQDHERLEVAQAWIAFEHMSAHAESGAVDAAACDDASGGAGAARDAILVAARALAMSCRDPAAASRRFACAADLAQAHGLVLLEVTCLLQAGAASHELGDDDLAARLFDAAARRARATGWPMLIATCDTCLGALLCDLGAYDESRHALATAIESLSTRPRGLALAAAHAALARTLLAMRRANEAAEQMDAAMALLRDADRRRDLAAHLILHARVLAEAGQPARAADLLGEAQSLVESCGLDALRAVLHQALADLHHRFALAPPPRMSLPSAALHFAEAALAHGGRLPGWSACATLLDFLAERWAESGDHERAYGYARRALVAKERETAQKMGYPLSLLRVRRHAEVGADPDLDLAVNERGAPGTH